MTRMAPSETPAGPAAAASVFSPTLARLWVGVLLPPAAWVSDLLTRYMVIRYASTHGRIWPLHLSTAFGLTLLALGARLCWQARRAAMQGHVDGDIGDGTTARAAMATLSVWGLALSLFFFLLIGAQAYPTFVLAIREIT
jgi:hypothetical protein